MRLVLDLFYFLNILLVLCQLLLNLFYSVNIMLQLYQENRQFIFVPEHYLDVEQSIC